MTKFDQIEKTSTVADKVQHSSAPREADLSNESNSRLVQSLLLKSGSDYALHPITIVDTSAKGTRPMNKEFALNPLLKYGSDLNDLSYFKIHGTPAISVHESVDGDAFARFALDRRTADEPMRTELVSPNEKDRLDFGKEYSIAFRNRLVDFKPDKSAEIIFQLHPIPANDNWSGSKSNPDVTLRTRNGMYEFTSRRHVIWSAPYKEGEWNDWQVKMRVAGDDTPGGYLDLFRNGVKVANAQGPNVFSKDNLGLPQTNQVYAKFGIYKWDWKEGLPATDSTRRVLDYDNFQVSELPPGARNAITSVAKVSESAPVNGQTAKCRSNARPTNENELPIASLISSMNTADRDQNGALSIEEVSKFLRDLNERLRTRPATDSSHQTHAPAYNGHKETSTDPLNHPGKPNSEISTEPTVATGPKEDYAPGRFHTLADQIIGPDGKRFLARGFAMYGWDAKNPKYLDWVVNDLKPNIVRIAAHPDSDSPRDLQKAIDYLTAHGIVALVEDHTGYYRTSKDGYNMPSNEKLKQLAQWYSEIAAANKDNSKVWFGTPNEPSGSEAATVNEEKTIYDAIRATGNESIILLEKNYSKLGSDPIKNNPGVFKQMRNVALDAHYYLKTDNTDASLDWALKQDRSLGIPVVVGEFGNYDFGTWTNKSVESVIKANGKGEVGAIAWALRNDRGANPQRLVGADVMYDNNDNQTPYGKKVEQWLHSS